MNRLNLIPTAVPALLLALSACAELPLVPPAHHDAAAASRTLQHMAEARIGFADLAVARGGIRVGGIDFGLGVTLRTAAATQNLVSELTLSDAGRWVAASSSATNAPPSGFSVSGLGTGNFQATLGDPSTTQVIQSLNNAGIGTIVTNRMNGVSIAQTTSLNITLNNYSQLAQSMTSWPMIGRMGHDFANFRIK